MELAAPPIRRRHPLLEGFRFLHCLGSCPPGWRYPTADTVEIVHRAIDSHYFPLLEVDGGVWRITQRPKRVLPVRVTYLIAKESVQDAQALRLMTGGASGGPAQLAVTYAKASATMAVLILLVPTVRSRKTMGTSLMRKPLR